MRVKFHGPQPRQVLQRNWCGSLSVAILTASLEASLGKIDELIHIGRRMRSIALLSMQCGLLFHLRNLVTSKSRLYAEVCRQSSGEISSVKAD